MTLTNWSSLVTSKFDDLSFPRGKSTPQHHTFALWKMRYSLLLVRTILTTNKNCTLHYKVQLANANWTCLLFVCCLSFVYVQTLIDAHLDYVFFDVIQITSWHKTKSSYYIFSILGAYVLRLLLAYGSQQQNDRTWCSSPKQLAFDS